MLICPHCGQEELGQATTCRRCGEPLPFKTLLDLPAVGGQGGGTCIACGAKLPALAGQCPVCGRSSRLPSEEIPTEVAKQGVREAAELETAAESFDAEEDDDWGAEAVPTTETRGLNSRKSTTELIKAVFADSPDAAPAPHEQETIELSRDRKRILEERLGDADPDRTIGDTEAGEDADVGPAAEPAAPQPRGSELDVTLPPTSSPPIPKPTREQAIRVEEALARATAAERLDAAAKVVESSIDRSSPRMQAIHTGPLPSPEQPDNAGVRAVLEPPVAPGRSKDADVGFEDPTSVYPAMVNKPPAPAVTAPFAPSVKTEPVKPLPPLQQGDTQTVTQADARPSASAPETTESAQTEAEPQTCSTCGALMADGSKFCGSCGRSISQPMTRLMPSRSAEPTPVSMRAGSRGRLVLVRGSSHAGTTWVLADDVTSAGRLVGKLLFSNDLYLSPLHATFYFRDDKLYVRDEGSRNGVFVRLRRPTEITAGDRISVGRQLLILAKREQWQNQIMPEHDSDGTKLLASPTGSESIVLLRVFGNGAQETYVRHQRVVSIGRAGCDINFEEDDFLSHRHARVLQSGASTVVEDLGSRNGTFQVVRSDLALESGDEVMIGSQVLRLERG